MKVGITYDLKDDYIKMGYSAEESAEFDSEETISGIETSLKRLGYEVERIGNVKALIKKLAEGSKWDLVFNIAEGMYGYGRESQVPAILDAYQIPYTFSDPMVLALTLHKGMAKNIIKSKGLHTPDFYVVKKVEDVKKINLKYPLFVKPVAEGTGKGISRKSIVNNVDELTSICRELIVKFKQPALVEEFLPGREFTVGVGGTGRNSFVMGVTEVIFSEEDNEVYGYNNKAHYEKHIKYIKPDVNDEKKCAKLALAAWKALECRDAGRVDIRYDAKANPNFIEVNPLAGLNPVHSDLPILCRQNNISFDDLIFNVIKSSIRRIKSRKIRKNFLDDYAKRLDHEYIEEMSNTDENEIII